MATSSFYNSSGSTPAVENSIQTAVQEAAGSATQAATAATEANTSATNAEGSLNSFQRYYLGAYSSAPTTSQSGAMYFDTGTNQLYIWSGSSWDVTASANNLQDTDGLSEGSSNLYFTNERVDDRVNALLTAGSNVTLTYNDTANTLTIASTASGGGGGGSTTFTGLTDTFSSYTGQAYRYLMVNSTEDGVTTVTPNTDDVAEGSSNLYFTNARATSAITSSDLDMGGNKVLFGNMYSAESDLPSAATYHGMFAHVHSTGKGYFAHGGGWHKLLDETSSDTDDLTEGTSNLYFTNERVDDRVNSLLTAGSNITLTYNDAGNSLTIASTAAGGGEDYVDIQTSSGTQPSASGTDGMAFGKAAVVGSSASNGISIGSSATVNGASSISIGLNTSTSTNAGSTALGANAIANAANQLMLGAASGYVGALTSVRVGNSNYTPSNAMDLATKSYVDANSGSGTSTFTGLTDTPASMGTSGQYLAVNSGGTALEFVAAPAGGGSGIALTDLSATNAAAGTAGLAYNSGTGLFTFTPPDLSSYATTASLATVATSGAYGDLTGTPTLASVATSGAYADLTGTPSLTGYLTAITGESLSDLSDVNNTTPTDGQVLTWDNTNSYWKPVDAASGGGSPAYLAHGTDADVSGSPTATGDNAIGFGYGASGSGADSIAIGNEAVASGTGAIKIGRDSGTNPISGTTAIGIGWNASATALQSIAIGQNASATADQGVAIGYAATTGFTESIALGKSASTTSTNQLMLGATTSTDGFTSIRVGNTSYTPTNNMDLATKAYVDANAGGGVDWADVSTYHNLAPTTSGNYGMSLGFGAAGTGIQSIALGYKAKASGQGAINIQAGSPSGTILDASGADSIVIGTASEATADETIAIGDGASADAARSISIGRSANVSQTTYTDSVAIGNLASVNAANQIMLGGTSITSVRVGNTSYAPSDNMDLATKSYVDSNAGGGTVNYIASDSTGSATASGSTSLAVGDGAVASALRSLAVGYGADATASYTSSFGHFAEALAESSTALGYDTNVSSTHANSIALGRGATTTAARQLMLGIANTSTGLTSVQVGNTSYAPSNAMDLTTKSYVDAKNLADLANVNNTTPTDGQVLTWDNTNSYWKPETASSGGGGITGIAFQADTGAAGVDANDYFAMAMGGSSYANGLASVALGYQAKTNGNSAISIGHDAGYDGNDQQGIAIGYATVTNGQNNYPIAIGYRAECLGGGGIAIGSGYSSGSTHYYARASLNCIAIGMSTYTYGTSVAIGHQAWASGVSSTALGKNTYVTGSNSTCIGHGAQSTSANRFVLGNSSVNDLRCQDTGISAVSDRRDKTQIEALSVGLDFVNAIEPKAYYKNNRNEYYDPAYTDQQLADDDTLEQSYTFNQANYEAATEKFTKREFGFVAQEVADELPATYSDARVSFAETDDIHGFDVQRFTPADMLPIAWKALRELSTKHDQLQSDYDALLARVVALENA